MVARSKRVLKGIKGVSEVWVRLGNLVYISKKPLNSRMGKGNGSLFSIRRFIHAGSKILKHLSYRSGLNDVVLTYIKSRVVTGIKYYCATTKEWGFMRSEFSTIRSKKRPFRANRGRRVIGDFSYSFTRKEKFL